MCKNVALARRIDGATYDCFCNVGRSTWGQPYMLSLMADAGVTSRIPDSLPTLVSCDDKCFISRSASECDTACYHAQTSSWSPVQYVATRSKKAKSMSISILVAKASSRPRRLRPQASRLAPPSPASSGRHRRRSRLRRSPRNRRNKGL